MITAGLIESFLMRVVQQVPEAHQETWVAYGVDQYFYIYGDVIPALISSI